jgi:PKD repeat protein
LINNKKIKAMKRLLFLMLSLVFAFQTYAENLNVTGQVNDVNGAVVVNHMVMITSLDSISGFTYSNMVFTNEAGEFAELIDLPADISQGEVVVSTESCDGVLIESQFFYPGNYELYFSFEICSDSAGGGNDTITDCENFFYYDVNGLVANFNGMVYPEDEEATYSWSFGDGTSGDGALISHEYAAEGEYTVTLYTESDEDCSASSMQLVWIANDTSGGNDSTIYCENYFYYDVEEQTASFFGQVIPESDDAIYAWNFGDGTTGDGEEISHDYAEDGLYFVALTTITGDCNAVSYQEVRIGDDSIPEDCANYFEYQVNDLSVAFEGWAIGNDEDADFYWDFGDGNNGEGGNISHVYGEAGLYIVTLTTVAGDSCTAISSLPVEVGDAVGGQTVFGSVFANSQPLDYGQVIMFSADLDSNDYYVVRIADVDSLGLYYFDNVPDGDYLILSFPDPMSNYFDTYLPTYYGDVIFWENATPISLGNANNPYNIHLVNAQGANAGDGVISGDIVGEGFKDQLDESDISLFLLDENNNPLEITYSEINNTFDFSNIAYGTYTVYAEITGLPTEAATLTLSDDNPSAQITIQVDANGATTGLGSQPSAFVEEIGNVYPNPVLQQASVQLKMKKQSSISISIYNQIGQLIQSKTITAQSGSSIITLSTNKLTHGVYSLQIVSDDGAYFNQKFIK